MIQTGVLLRTFSFLLFVMLCRSQSLGHVTIRTNKTLVYLSPQNLVYHVIEPGGKKSENAFVVYFNGFREISPNNTIVQFSPPERGNYTTTISESRQPSEESDLQYDDAFQINFENLLGTTFTFWVFTRDQTVTDLRTQRSFQVREGSLKYSLVMPLWPFENAVNRLQVSTNITTLIPNTMTEAVVLPIDDETSAMTIKAKGITVDFQLYNKASIFHYETSVFSFINVKILFFVCPLDEYGEQNTLGELTGEFCHLSLHNGSFPFAFSSTTSELSSDKECSDEDKPAIEMIEIKIQWDNFINSALDYDPEMSILFDGGERNADCSSEEYEIRQDPLFWLSVSFGILAICLICIIVLLGSSKKGLQLIRGRKSFNSQMRAIEKNVTKLNI